MPPQQTHTTQRCPSWQPSLFSFANAPMRCLEGHSGCVNALRWSRDGALLFSGSDDRRLGVWTLHAVLEAMRGTTTPDAPLSSSSRLGTTGSTQGTFLQTAHGNNIFDIALIPHSSNAVSITAAADGTIAINDLIAESSVIYYSAQQEAAASRSQSHRMAQQVHCIEDNPHVLVAAAAMQIQLFDLRTRAEGGLQHRSQHVLGRGSVFCALPRTCGSLQFLVAHQHVVREVDLRRTDCEQVCHLQRPQPDTTSHEKLLVSGMDVSADGDWLAVSRMGGGIETVRTASCVPSLMHCHEPSCDIADYHLLAQHENVRTFLKKPAMFRYNGGWCVAHGGDCGSAFLYELRDDTCGNPILEAGYDAATIEAIRILSKPMPLMSVPRCPDISRRVARVVDGGVCNVVAPHPTLVHYSPSPYAANNTRTPTTPFLNVFATSGLDASIKVVAITDDNASVLKADGFAAPAASNVVGRMGPSYEWPDGVVENALLRASDVVKALATGALQQHRNLRAMELYGELAAILLGHPAMHRYYVGPPPAQGPPVRTTTVALLSNAQLAALKGGQMYMCKLLCDAALTLDARHAKSYYRRAMVSRSLGAVENALSDVQQASQCTGGTDEAVEALRAALVTEAASVRLKEKQRFAKMFGGR